MHRLSNDSTNVAILLVEAVHLAKLIGKATLGILYLFCTLNSFSSFLSFHQQISSSWHTRRRFTPCTALCSI